MKSTVLQNKTLIGSDNQDSTSSEVDASNNVTATEEKISKVEVRYKQKRQNLEQQRSIQPQVDCQFCVKGFMINGLLVK